MSSENGTIHRKNRQMEVLFAVIINIVVCLCYSIYRGFIKSSWRSACVCAVARRGTSGGDLCLE